MLHIVPWFLPEDYDTIRTLVGDDPDFLPTHEAWLEAANNHVAKREAGNRRVVKAIIKPQEFAAWCHAAGVDHNSTSLGAFAVVVGSQQQDR